MDSKKFLDKTGLGTLWEKVKSKAEDTLNASKNHTNSFFTDGSAKKAIADQNGAVIHENYIQNSLKGVANGIATLDNYGKVPSSQLPSYVDDILEFATKPSFPTSGESGKIYVAQDTNKTYRWTGTVYAEIKGDLTIGTVTGTAYDGGKGTELEKKVEQLENGFGNINIDNYFNKQEIINNYYDKQTINNNYYNKQEINNIIDGVTMTPLTTDEINSICQ